MTERLDNNAGARTEDAQFVNIRGKLRAQWTAQSNSESGDSLIRKWRNILLVQTTSAKSNINVFLFSFACFLVA